MYPLLPRGWCSVMGGWNSAMGSLAAVDQSLDPAGAGRRFPRLRRIELHAHFWSSQEFSSSYDAAEKRETQDIERVADPLPRLKAAGLLQEFRVDNVVCGPGASDFMDDVYWPSDSET
ncbi:hypothetical protein GSI_11461 [Ganoderma sinense ZZ0214-1]|uniref:Uncharacterized protein n=1 Tax=Ganoderma sinense ZZ0214-1 TaxID=1077348 RepID=A0A2G8RW23_9APHY|nr:hypothetical protein GSI_11461 [Ganoderma sinense ZZ0214-1]